MQAHLFLVSYDVSCPKRWRRIQKIITSICRRGQLSVFVCRATQARIKRLESELRTVLHHRDDRLMILDLGAAHRTASQVANLNPIQDIAELGAVIL